MKIHNMSNPDALKAYGANSAQRTQEVRNPENKQHGSTVSLQDKVDISSKVRMFQDIKTAALDAPDIRTEKVEQIEQQISTGTYRPDYSVVADKLLSPDVNLRI